MVVCPDIDMRCNIPPLSRIHKQTAKSPHFTGGLEEQQRFCEVKCELISQAAMRNPLADVSLGEAWLALRELALLAGALEAELFSFALTRVTAKQVSTFQRATDIFV